MCVCGWVGSGWVWVVILFSPHLSLTRSTFGRTQMQRSGFTGHPGRSDPTRYPPQTKAEGYMKRRRSPRNAALNYNNTNCHQRPRYSPSLLNPQRLDPPAKAIAISLLRSLPEFDTEVLWFHRNTISWNFFGFPVFFRFAKHPFLCRFGPFYHCRSNSLS